MIFESTSRLSREEGGAIQGTLIGYDKPFILFEAGRLATTLRSCGCPMKPSHWFSSLFKRQPPPSLRHSLFGELVFSRSDGWINKEFELWGFKGGELLLVARQDGPSR